MISAVSRGELWTKSGGVWQGDADTDYSVTETANGFIVTNDDDSSNHYDSSGRLLLEQAADGKTTTYTYNGQNQLESVTNHFGHTLSLTWDSNNHIDTVVSPNGDTYSYAYDPNDNLVSVTYPGGITRLYHYENGDFSNHLTGITDENGDRIATYAYDSQGRAISTEHAIITGGSAQEKFQIDYGQ